MIKQILSGRMVSEKQLQTLAKIITQRSITTHREQFNHLVMEGKYISSVWVGLRGSESHFLHWKDSLDGTLSRFLAHQSSTEGILLCFICHKGHPRVQFCCALHMKWYKINKRECLTFGALVHVIRGLEPGCDFGLAVAAHRERCCRMRCGLPSYRHTLRQQTQPKVSSITNCFLDEFLHQEGV